MNPFENVKVCSARQAVLEMQPTRPQAWGQHQSKAQPADQCGYELTGHTIDPYGWPLNYAACEQARCAYTAHIPAANTRGPPLPPRDYPHYPSDTKDYLSDGARVSSYSYRAMHYIPMGDV